MEFSKQFFNKWHFYSSAKPSCDLQYPQPTDGNSVTLLVNEEEVQNYIMLFPNGSAPGIDGLRPQHLKNL